MPSPASHSPTPCPSQIPGPGRGEEAISERVDNEEIEIAKRPGCPNKACLGLETQQLRVQGVQMPFNQLAPWMTFADTTWDFPDKLCILTPELLGETTRKRISVLSFSGNDGYYDQKSAIENEIMQS